MSEKRGGGAVSILLLVVGIGCLIAGSACLYVKQNVLDSGELSKHVVASLERSAVRQFIAKKTASEIVKRVPALDSDRKEVETATNKVVATDQFKKVLGAAVVVAESRIVDNDRNGAAMKLQNIGAAVSGQLETIDPSLAARIPDDLDAKVASLSGAPAIAGVARTLKTIGFLGIILPPIAILMLIGSVVLDPDRRAATTRLGVTLIVAAIVLIVVSYLGRARVLDIVPSGLERDAAGGVWDEVIGRYRTWLIAGGVAGIALVLMAFAVGRSRRDPAYA